MSIGLIIHIQGQEITYYPVMELIRDILEQSIWSCWCCHIDFIYTGTSFGKLDQHQEQQPLQERWEVMDGIQVI